LATSKNSAKRAGPTISDVAERAGVSLSTVSRVMNGNRKVDEALSERVREAATALGYTASPLARSLVLGTTQTIAVVVPDLGNPTFQGALRGLSDAATAEGYHVLIADSHERSDQERDIVTQARRRCDGVVLVAPRMLDDDLSELLPQLSPAVVVNRVPSSPTTPSVTVDYRSGLTELLLHLYGLGHRRLLYLTGNPRAVSNRIRLEAIREFEGRHGDATVSLAPCGVGFSDGYDAAQSVLDSGATGVLAFNDLAAMGLLGALRERGVDVPGDVSVTGFDDIPFARYTAPPLTTVAVSVEDLGRQAWLRMSALLAGREAPDDVVFTPRLAVRASTGPAVPRAGRNAAPKDATATASSRAGGIPCGAVPTDAAIA
jgi:LacI family transcriptional regulator